MLYRYSREYDRDIDVEFNGTVVARVRRSVIRRNRRTIHADASDPFPYILGLFGPDTHTQPPLTPSMLPSPMPVHRRTLTRLRMRAPPRPPSDPQEHATPTSPSAPLPVVLHRRARPYHRPPTTATPSTSNPRAAPCCRGGSASTCHRHRRHPCPPGDVPALRPPV